MTDKKNAGYIIIVVTVILVAISLMGMTFINLTSIDFTATDNYANNLQAEMTARAGLEYATYVLNMDKYGTDSVVYNSNSYRYNGTTTLGYDETYDAYTEEWFGSGTGKIFCNATPASNDVDNNGDGTKDSKWLDVPFSLDKGLKAQYAILIEDVGESRINVNASGNIVGAGGTFVYGTGATTYDIRLQDVLGTTTAKNVCAGSSNGRYGVNGVPGNAGTTASQFQPRNPVGDDRPFNVLDAADTCFGTYTSPAIYQSRLRNIINDEFLFQSVRNNLTVYSFDAIITNNGISSLLLPDNKNYYRLKLDNTTQVGSITSQLQIAGFSQGTATQLAVHMKDYMDTDNDITAYGTPTRFGLEPHPFINELYYTGTNTGQLHQNLIELYNPFDTAISGSAMSINGSKMDLALKVAKTPYYLSDIPSCTWATGTVISNTYPIDTANFSMQAKGYVVLGYGTQNTVVSLSGTQTVTGFNIYDFDSNYVPQAVTVTLMGSSSAVGSGNYLILDEAVPNAYTNQPRGEDILWLLYNLIADINSTLGPGTYMYDDDAYQALIGQTGDGVWGPPHTSTKSGNRALPNLVEPNTGSNVVWNPGTNGVNDAISNLNSVISKTNIFVNNGQISPSAGAVIIADAQVTINLLNATNCNNNLNVRASIGERKNPLIERSNNWGTATTHTLGGTNTSFNSVPTNERKQLVVANNNMISLGEVGHLLTIGYGTQSPYTSNSTYNAAGSSTVDNAKLSLFSGTGTVIPEYFTILDPKNDSIDDDADGAVGTDTGAQAGDIDGPEIQVPGRININTAPSTVLSALPGTSTNTSIGTWSTLIQSKKGYSLINNIMNARPFSTIGTITSVTGMDYFGTDGVDNDGDGLVDEKDEKDLIFTSISNLITTHTNVFAVYVTARIVNSSASQTFAEKKLVAIVDRSVTPIKIRYFRWMTEW